MKKTLLGVSSIILSLALAGAAEQKLESIKLPPPQMDKGKTTYAGLEKQAITP